MSRYALAAVSLAGCYLNNNYGCFTITVCDVKKMQCEENMVPTEGLKIIVTIIQ